MGVEFGHFEIIRKLATGGMAELFLARHKSVGGFARNVVVKRILPEYSEIPSFVESFLNEARLAAQLNHPNIVQIYDLGMAGKSYFIAMEYIKGFDLSAILRLARKDQQQLPVDVALSMVRDMVAALDYAHNAHDLDGKPLGIVHRDVTPSNVIISVDGQAKMVDFGIAKATAQTEGRTRTGNVKGKASYLAPEQVLGKDIDRRVDVFACGIMAYELLTLRNPFRGDNDYVTLRNVVELTPPSCSDERAQIPAVVAAMVSSALRKGPAERTETCAAMLAQIEQAARDSGIQLSPSAVRAYIAAHEVALNEQRKSDFDLDLTSTDDGITVHSDMSKVLPRQQTRGVLVMLALLPLAVLAFIMFKPAPLAPIVVAVQPPVVPASSPASLPASAPVDTKAPLPLIVKRTPPVKVAPPLPVVVQGPPGRVRFSVQPWAEVELDGTVVGVTPMRTLDVPSGAHTLVLRNSELSKTVKLTIDVLSGEEMVVRRNMAD